MRTCFFLFVLLVLVSCSGNNEPKVSFYYWKTNYQLSANEQEILNNNVVQKMYIRYFDLDVNPQNKQIFPRNPIQFIQKPTVPIIVPVVYIKNQVFLQPDLQIDSLAKKVVQFTQKMNKQNDISTNEFQLDCDWTLQTKNNFLQFLKAVKKNAKVKISATIRLHQIKYAKKTGVPEADYGVLMYYNMGTLAPKSLNSIYNRETAEKYLKNLRDYPLSLNVALPIYAWGVHIRNQKIIGLRSKLTVEDLQLDNHFSMISDVAFRVNQSNFRAGVFYKEGDIIKIEAIKSSDLKEMARDLSWNLKHTPKEIIFYDLDEANFKNYEKTIFKQVSNRF